MKKKMLDKVKSPMEKENYSEEDSMMNEVGAEEEMPEDEMDMEEPMMEEEGGKEEAVSRAIAMLEEGKIEEALAELEPFAAMSAEEDMKVDEELMA